ncbi:hypothetical protein HEP84_32890 [Streptomyces sp. RLB1-33]|uniref:hypothetical protein n=1 Tax=Streptomyces mirabilis TaxID=68239 RepID=UPI00143E87EA|nr:MULTISPECIES: hypothetical protein [Streptomyces]QIY73220.1 hypothetical protein HEP84_32890 [Streptomyces sp. RLB1-33]QUW79805.1 hypothetical protein SMIR_12265 [Streptomyces mirabilis]
MHLYLVAFAALAMTGAALMGIAGIVTGWVPPWLRPRVFRPKLWGYGSVVGAVGMSLYLFIGPFRGPDLGMAPFAMTGMALFIAGLVLQIASRSPGRADAPERR